MNFIRNLLDRLAGQGLDMRPALRSLLRDHAVLPGLVSIIMPTRDRAAWLGRAVGSVLAQTYLNWELVIVDDGSTDDTSRFIRPYRAHRRVRYVRRAAGGAAAARNHGLGLARGALIAYLDSDNAWTPGFLAGMVSVFEDGAVQSAYGQLLRESQVPPLFQPFDRAALLQANYIDLNVFMHRQALVSRHGNFDVNLKRLADWDLILRFTEQAPAYPVAAAAAHYFTDAPQRLSDTQSFSAAYRAIRAKWRRYSQPPRSLRVLYVVWQYPQISETYIEIELQAMRRLGHHVELWAETHPGAPYQSAVTRHRGPLEAALAAARPDIVHVHWLNIAARFADCLSACGRPVTVRGHGFEVTPGAIAAVLGLPVVKRVYLNAHQIESSGLADARLTPVESCFDTSLFAPGRDKDPMLIVRAAAGLPSKDLAFFIELSCLCPGHRFVLAVVSCTLAEPHIGQLLALRRELNAPVEILLNRSHAEVAALMHAAAIYVHTVIAPDTAPGTPLGMPVSIAEALASGCYVLTRNLAPLVAYVGDGGAAYADIKDAARLIRQTEAWDEATWAHAAGVSTERAWSCFTGDDDLHRLHEHWVELARE